MLWSYVSENPAEVDSFPTRRSSDLQRTLTNGGTLTISGSGQMAMYSGSVLNNSAGAAIDVQRSEEHTSELSYRTTSYAVISSRKKKKSAGTGTSTITNNITLNDTGT